MLTEDPRDGEVLYCNDTQYVVVGCRDGECRLWVRFSKWLPENFLRVPLSEVRKCFYRESDRVR